VSPAIIPPRTAEPENPTRTDAPRTPSASDRIGAKRESRPTILIADTRPTMIGTRIKNEDEVSIIKS